jgi:hypothetical protein
LLEIKLTGNHVWTPITRVFQAAALEPSLFHSFLATLAQPTITSASLQTHQTGNPALTPTTHAEVHATGISLLYPLLLALHAPPTTKDAFRTTQWIGNLALAPTILALAGAPTKTKHSTCFHALLA